MELASCHPSGAWNLEVASRLLQNLCTSIVFDLETLTTLFFNRIDNESNHIPGEERELIVNLCNFHLSHFPRFVLRIQRQALQVTSH
jgi:hypothetical protein